MSKLLTIPEFADTLHITVACVRRWVLERRITTIRVGRLVRISQEEYQRIVEQGLVPAMPQQRGEMSSKQLNACGGGDASENSSL